MKRNSPLHDAATAGCEILGKTPRCVNRLQGQRAAHARCESARAGHQLFPDSQA